jgi:hypothetical protein
MSIRVKLSRHVKNNIKLYKISEEDISRAIELPDGEEREGGKRIAIKKFSKKYSGYPLKVVYEIEKEEIFVITAYPLKKQRWR